MKNISLEKKTSQILYEQFNLLTFGTVVKDGFCICLFTVKIYLYFKSVNLDSKDVLKEYLCVFL